MDDLVRIRDKSTNEVFDIDTSILSIRSIYFEVISNYEFIDPHHLDIIKKKFHYSESVRKNALRLHSDKRKGIMYINSKRFS